MTCPSIRPASLTLAGTVLLALAAGPLRAQSPGDSPIADYFAHWQGRVVAAQESQPKWITPMATTTPRLEQEFRYDQFAETLRNGGKIDVYGGGKGLELIPTERTEVILSLPAYQVRRFASPGQGTTDWPGILVKYRLLSGNEAHGNYVVSLFAQYGWPTGAEVFTSRNHVFTPTLAFGKGWGDFDIQGTIGEAMPTADHSRAGRSTVTNLTAQYHLTRILWPELELNRTDWQGGARDGRCQEYLSPGIIFGRFQIGPDNKLIVGVSYQTAISKNYPTNPATPAFNHNWIVSVRTTF